MHKPISNLKKKIILKKSVHYLLATLVAANKI